MPDHAAIKLALEERLEQLHQRARTIDQDLSEPGDDDWDEAAAESQGDEVLEGVGRAAVEEIQRIQRALAALSAGTYGTCTRCGASIAPERLEALPATLTCRSCA